MCGIFFAQLSSHVAAYQVSKPRGPDASAFVPLGTGGEFHFHRLRVRGTDEAFMQPMVVPEIRGSVAINGEVYGLQRDRFDPAQRRAVQRDCAFLVDLARSHGFDWTTALREVNGEYAGVCVSECVVPNGMLMTKVQAFRDPTGVRGLIAGRFPDGSLVLSSTMVPGVQYAQSVEPNRVSTWEIMTDTRYTGSFSITGPVLSDTIHPIRVRPSNLKTWMEAGGEHMAFKLVRDALIEGVRARVQTKDSRVGVGAFLSGGVDSSLIASIVQRCIPTIQTLRTFSIGLPGSPDVAAAEKVALELGTNHTSYFFTPQEAINIVPEVITALGSCDITTVRASIPHYICAKRIRQDHPDIKIMLTGELADEASGSYAYFGQAPSHYEFDVERQRLLDEVHMFDNLRSDRCISAFGMEARVPFADTNFLEQYLSMPTAFFFWNANANDPRFVPIEKWLLRESFREILPEPALSRRKTALSNGCSPSNHDLATIMRSFAEQQITEEELEPFRPELSARGNVSKEAAWYLNTLISTFGPGARTATTLYWLPRWTSTTDPSARELESFDGD